ncbi:hypothetical protein [Serratia entomophila]|uniref:hypothetical protein n=1 Tax=Serratia entomophila TaxID=42906 RepID=UPI0021B7EB35|nr:hypothetical protein [Serratia entomophila]
MSDITKAIIHLGNTIGGAISRYQSDFAVKLSVIVVAGEVEADSTGKFCWTLGEIGVITLAH